MFKTKYRICELGNGKFIAEKLGLGFIPLDTYLNENGYEKWYRTDFVTQEKAEAAVLLKLERDKEEREETERSRKANSIVRTIKKLP